MANRSSSNPFMEQLYAINNFFLHSVVQPRTIDSLFEELSITNLNTFVSSFSSSWQSWANYFIGYLIFVAIGVLFVILVPIVGLCVCSCRCCCKNCGAKVSERDGKNAKYCGICCGVFLLFFATIMVFGCVMSVVASVSLYHRTSTASSSALMPGLGKSIDILHDYRDDSIADLNAFVTNTFIGATDGIIQAIKQLPVAALNMVGNVTNAKPLLERLVDYFNSLPEMQLQLEIVQNCSELLLDYQTLLTDSLTQLRSDISTDANLCSPISPTCQNIYDNVVHLRMAADYNELGDVTLPYAALTYVLDDNVVKSVEQGIKQFHNISIIINATLSTELNKVTKEVEDLSLSVFRYMSKITERLAALDLSFVKNSLRDIQPYVDTYGSVFFYCTLALSGILLLIIISYYVGLIHGACCKRPSEKRSCCTKATGAGFMLTGVAFSFIFSWGLMIVTTLMFAVGGVSETEACRHFLFHKESRALSAMDGLLTSALKMNISFINITSKCQQNMAIYTALDTEALGINISSILDVDNYPIKPLLQDVKRSAAASVNIGSVTILSEEANQTLQVLDAGLNSANLSSFYTEIEKNVTKLNLVEYSHMLDYAAESEVSSESLKTRLREHAKNLRSLNDTVLSAILETNSKLSKALTKFETLRDSISILQLISDLTFAQNNLRKYGNGIITGNINETVNSIYGVIVQQCKNADYIVRHDLSRCRPVYNSLGNAVDQICLDTVFPFNGLWFSHGFSLVCLIPAIGLAMKLSSLYRKPYGYSAVCEPVQPVLPTSPTGNVSLHYMEQADERRAGQDNIINNSRETAT